MHSNSRAGILVAQTHMSPCSAERSSSCSQLVTPPCTDPIDFGFLPADTGRSITRGARCLLSHLPHSRRDPFLGHLQCRVGWGGRKKKPHAASAVYLGLSCGENSGGPSHSRGPPPFATGASPATADRSGLARGSLYLSASSAHPRHLSAPPPFTTPRAVCTPRCTTEPLLSPATICSSHGVYSRALGAGIPLSA